MSKLKLLGALVARSIDSMDDAPQELRDLIQAAALELDSSLDDEQYELWEQMGMPTFKAETKYDPMS